MKSRHIQEMSAWPGDAPEDKDDWGLFKALVVGVPLGLLLWGGVWWLVPRAWRALLWAL